MSIYFVSDTHFGHKNVIKHCGRPFESMEQMDQAMIDNWNKTVSRKDTIYHLGDLSFHNIHDTRDIIKQLNGHKILIRGNHDRFSDIDYLKMGFERVRDYEEIKWNKRKFILCHFPFLTWNGSHRGNLHLHGHCHGTLNHLNVGVPRIDVGVDNFDFAPIHVDKILELIGDIQYIPVDHHGENGKR